MSLQTFGLKKCPLRDRSILARDRYKAHMSNAPEDVPLLPGRRGMPTPSGVPGSDDTSHESQKLGGDLMVVGGDKDGRVEHWDGRVEDCDGQAEEERVSDGSVSDGNVS